jgi:hypothetical protein
MCTVLLPPGVKPTAVDKCRIFTNLIRALFTVLEEKKKSEADYNRVRIRFAVENWILEK